MPLTYNREYSLVCSTSGGDIIQSEPGSAGVCSSMCQDQRYEGNLASVNLISTNGPTSGDPLHAYPISTPLNLWNDGDPWYNCHCADDDVRGSSHRIARTCCHSHCWSEVCHCRGIVEGLPPEETISLVFIAAPSMVKTTFWIQPNLKDSLHFFVTESQLFMYLALSLPTIARQMPNS